MSFESQITGLAIAVGKSIGKLEHWPMVCDSIKATETVTIPANCQLIIARQLTNTGLIINSGVLYIL